jgi:hypothetical protein
VQHVRSDGEDAFAIDEHLIGDAVDGDRRSVAAVADPAVTAIVDRDRPDRRPARRIGLEGCDIGARYAVAEQGGEDKGQVFGAHRSFRPDFKGEPSASKIGGHVPSR